MHKLFNIVNITVIFFYNPVRLASSRQRGFGIANGVLMPYSFNLSALDNDWVHTCGTDSSETPAVRSSLSYIQYIIESEY